MALGTLLSCGGVGGARVHIPVVSTPPAAEGPALATFVFVGDTIAHGMDPAIDPLEDVAPLLEGADAFVLNHEGVLASRPLPTPCEALPNQSLLDADPRSADAYARAPAVVATLANNHVVDCAGDGLAGTRDALRARGFRTVGAGLDAAEACTPLRFVVGGLDTAFVAYLAMSPDVVPSNPAGPTPARWETCGGAAIVAEQRARGAFVVAALHLHLAPSWTDATAPEHRLLVEEVFGAGADLVVAHGPHVPQGILVRGGQVALLSLGNFLFAQDEPLPEAARDVVVARVTVHARQILVTLSAARLDLEGRPLTPSPADTDRILDALHRLSATSDAPLVRSGDRAYLLVER